MRATMCVFVFFFFILRDNEKYIGPLETIFRQLLYKHFANGMKNMNIN